MRDWTRLKIYDELLIAVFVASPVKAAPSPKKKPIKKDSLNGEIGDKSHKNFVSVEEVSDTNTEVIEKDTSNHWQDCRRDEEVESAYLF